MQQINYVQSLQEISELQGGEKAAHILTQINTVIGGMNIDNNLIYNKKIDWLYEIAKNKPFLAYLKSTFSDQGESKNQLLNILQENDGANQNNLISLIAGLKEQSINLGNTEGNELLEYLNSLISLLCEVTNHLEEEYNITLFRRLSGYKNITLNESGQNHIACILLNDLQQLIKTGLPIGKKLSSLAGIYPKDIFSFALTSQSQLDTAVDREIFESTFQEVSAQLSQQDDLESTIQHIINELCDWLKKQKKIT